MTKLDMLNWCVFAYGVFVAGFSFKLFLRFYRSPHPLGRSLAWDKVDAIVANLITLIFSVMTYAHFEHHFSPVWWPFLRIVIFSGSLFASWNLHVKVRKIEDGE